MQIRVLNSVGVELNGQEPENERPGALIDLLNERTLERRQRIVLPPPTEGGIAGASPAFTADLPVPVIGTAHRGFRAELPPSGRSAPVRALARSRIARTLPAQLPISPVVTVLRRGARVGT
jgi:hypothetical protein